MDVNSIFLLAATIISIGFIANLIFKRTKIPDLVWLLILGLLIGPGLKILERSIFVSAMPYLSSLALLIILFDAGLNMNIYKLIKEVPRGSLLAFSGFILSTLSVASFSMIVLEMDIILSLLLGSILGGVSSAIVIPIVSELDFFREEPALLLDIESVITDPLCIIVSLALIDMIMVGTGTHIGFYTALQDVISSFSISIVLGFFAGTIWLALLEYLRKEDYYYMMTLGFLFLIYPIVEFLGGNGAISSLIVGVVLGNGSEFGKMLKVDFLSSGLTKRTKSFQSELSFLIKSFFLVSLGAMITFGEIQYFTYGGVIALVLLGARWLAVEISTLKAKFKPKEIKTMAFMVPRGLAPAVLVTITSYRNIPGTESFTLIAFSVIIATAVISTLGVSLFGNSSEVKNVKEEPPVEE